MSTIRKIKTTKLESCSDYGKLFFHYQNGRGLAAKTIKVQRNIINILLKEAPSDFSNESDWKKAIAKLLANKNEAYYNKILTTSRQFFDFLIDEGLLCKNPSKDFKYRREGVRIVRHSEETIRRFLNAINKETFAGLRDYAFCVLMLDTGIRPSEAVQICLRDIDFKIKQVHVKKEYAKTGVERYLPISIQTLHVLQKIIAVRPEDWKNDTPILCTYDGKPLSTTAIRDRFQDYSRLIGEKVTTYDLRHTFALYFIKNGGDAFALQRIMGHTKMNMTQIYVNLAIDDVAKKHEAATPLLNFIANKRVRNLKQKK